MSTPVANAVRTMAMTFDECDRHLYLEIADTVAKMELEHARMRRLLEQYRQAAINLNPAAGSPLELALYNHKIQET